MVKQAIWKDAEDKGTGDKEDSSQDEDLHDWFTGHVEQTTGLIGTTNIHQGWQNVHINVTGVELLRRPPRFVYIYLQNRPNVSINVRSYIGCVVLVMSCKGFDSLLPAQLIRN